jgi:hypothetical protein
MLASQHLNCVVEWAGISVAVRADCDASSPSEFKGCRLTFVGRAYWVFLSATESQKLNEMGRPDRICIALN